jgi:SnoaL-like domain
MTKFALSPEHATYRPLMEPFWKRGEEQEAMLVKAGLPAKGAVEWGRRYFAAAAAHDFDAIADCMTEDVVLMDPITFPEERHGRETMIDCWRDLLAPFPDLVFYPQDDTARSMPSWNFFGGATHVTIPWRAIGRFTEPVKLPNDGPTIAPTGKCVSFVGVDRYVLTDDWKIARLDSDFDLLSIARQISPVRLPGPTNLAVRGLLALHGAVTPAYLKLARIS